MLQLDWLIWRLRPNSVSKGSIEIQFDARLQSLAAAAPGRAEELQGQRDRLVGPREMGELFKVMAFTAPGWPAPAAFTGDAA